MDNPGISFVYPFLSTFIERDREILARNFRVNSVLYRGRKDVARLARNVIMSDISFSWFALSHAHLAVLFSSMSGRKSIVVTGGWDVVSIPELGYGEMRNPASARMTESTLKRADRVLAVSESNKKDVMQWVDDANIEVVYHGFDSEVFSPKGDKQRQVVTVAGISRQTLGVKGLKTFVEAARLLEDVSFVLIGSDKDGTANLLRENAPPNLSIVGHLSDAALLQQYREAKVYAQLSAQESFGCAVAEAMLCECLPVVTRRGALPEVCGKTGFYVRYGDAEETARVLERALESDRGYDARKRIVKEFPLSGREERLKRIIGDL